MALSIRRNSPRMELLQNFGTPVTENCTGMVTQVIQKNVVIGANLICFLGRGVLGRQKKGELPEVEREREGRECEEGQANPNSKQE